MREQSLIETMIAAVEEAGDEDGSEFKEVVPADWRPLSQTGYLTGDKGVWLRLPSGEEFILTVQRQR